ncbi:MAG: hypothetical protein JOY62_11855 [Acidobacteriaceae bacterium]|nr:hypothetical protein [Acidobacteriaceae bacterium]MBV9780655.1 hypothetical protein [Acidobacteriaceae bacterium]
MTKLHHRSTAKARETIEPEALHATIQTFLASCRNPAVVEYGEEMIRLLPEQYNLEIRSGRVSIEVWCETRSISRRILAIERHATGVLDCTVHRFGGKPGKLSFLDLDRPQTAHKTTAGLRHNFAEQFRRMLSRQFPGWEICTLSCGMDLQRSFSPVFPRALLVRGNRQIAALACSDRQDEPALLSSALIWHDYVHAHRRSGAQTSLGLFLPDTAGNLSAHRLKWLTGKPLEAYLYRFNSHGSAGEVDPQDLGNLQTRLSTQCKQERFECNATGLPPAARQSLIEAPERYLELSVRSNLSAIDARLLPDPVYSQVLTFAAGDRDLIDLLAVSLSGRLAVLELKASEDIHLPLQALDYWMRIRWHTQRGELQHLFPGISLEETLPQLLLVAPAMCFHPSNAIVLSYFTPAIDVERVGVNSDWRHNFKVVMRLKGAETPVSHRSSQ